MNCEVFRQDDCPVFDQASDLILIHDPEGRILQANRSACRALGIPAEKLKTMTMADILSEEHAPRIQEVMEQILQKESFRFETVFRCQAGRTLPVEVQANVLHLGQEPLIQSIARDISERAAERQRLEEHVSRLTSEVAEAREQQEHQERLALIGQVATSMAHELRNPLGAINNAVYFLSMILDSEDPRIAKHLRIMRRELGECRRLVDELLEFSRTTVLKRERINLTTLIERALERIAWSERIQVKKNFPSEPIFTSVDAPRLTQVLVNLFVNAIEAMPQGGTLSITLTQNAEFAEIHVRDTGTGIAPDQLPRIFEPLFTTKPKGVGLGLAVCKRIVELHGGTISVESLPGQGSLFKVRLPKDHDQETHSDCR